MFTIDVERCRRWGGRLRVIASIAAPDVIERILLALNDQQGQTPPSCAIMVNPNRFNTLAIGALNVLSLSVARRLVCCVQATGVSISLCLLHALGLGRSA